MRVLIADDEPLALEQLRRWVEEEPGVKLVGAAADGWEAVQLADRLRPDLIILDIQMPSLDGLSAARELSTRFAPQIVFFTAFPDYALKAFEIDAADYLLKPARRDRLREAIRRAARRIELNGRTGSAPGSAEGLWIPSSSGSWKLPFDQIKWIEAAKDYALLHTPTRTHIVRVTMTELERQLDPNMLLRVHRPAFVRLAAITALEKKGRRIARVTMEDGAIVDVGSSYSQRLAEALSLGL